jgi:hypothetical protein
MAETTLEPLKRPRMLIPLPVVVDADVLIRNVDYTVRLGREGALLAGASSDYTLFSGVVLFATERVLEEVERHLPDVARRRGVGYDDAVAVWNDIFLPRLRIVELSDGVISDSRVHAIRALHANDAPTAALAVALAPCVLLTDNRKHFVPLGLPDRPTDEIAIDAHALSQYVTGMNCAVLVTGLTGSAVIEGSKKVISLIGKDGAILVALILSGAAILYWRSEPGGRFRTGVRAAAREIGPPLMDAVERGMAASEKVSAMAIESADDSKSALSHLAQRLATGRTVMSTTEVARELRTAGYSFPQPGTYQTQVRAWLLQNDCFFEIRRGNWTLGYHARELPLDT